MPLGIQLSIARTLNFACLKTNDFLNLKIESEVGLLKTNGFFKIIYYLLQLFLNDDNNNEYDIYFKRASSSFIMI